MRPVKITLESTPRVVSINDGGVKARIWQGQTETGIAVHAYVVLVSVRTTESAEILATFERELTEHAGPREEVRAIPLRLIL